MTWSLSLLLEIKMMRLTKLIHKLVDVRGGEGGSVGGKQALSCNLTLKSYPLNADKLT